MTQIFLQLSNGHIYFLWEGSGPSWTITKKSVEHYEQTIGFLQFFASAIKWLFSTNYKCALFAGLQYLQEYIMLVLFLYLVIQSRFAFKHQTQNWNHSPLRKFGTKRQC